MPVVIALIGALPVFAHGCGGNTPPPKREDLQAVGLSVQNGPDAPPELQVLLRNTGDAVAVVDRIAFHILTFRDSDAVSGCYPLTQGDPPVSKKYELQLPAENGQGRIVFIDTPRELAPNAADRIRVRVSLDDYLLALSGGAYKCQNDGLGKAGEVL